jgi:hypothetical protein
VPAGDRGALLGTGPIWGRHSLSIDPPRPNPCADSTQPPRGQRLDDATLERFAIPDGASLF